MRPAPFDYREPESVEEACLLLAEHPGQVAVLAGGQSLVPQLNARLRRPALVVGLARITELGGVTRDGAVLRIGATVTQRALQRSEQVRGGTPVLLTALDHVGHVPTRNRGTLGGSIAFADPAAELPVVLLGVGGAVRARSTEGERTIAAADLFAGAFRTALRPDELLTAVELPCSPPGWRWAFEQRHFRRHAKISVLAGTGPGGELAVALGGVGDVPVVLPGAAARHDAGGPAAVAAAAADLVTPIADRYGSVDYRRALTVLAVTAAVGPVTGDSPGTARTPEVAA